MSHTYNPQALVLSFTKEYGELGILVLEIFNTIDPLSCYYGDDCNPDEYLGYAKRFITSLEQDSIWLNNSRRVEVLPAFVLELFRRCFSTSQIAEGWVSEAAITALRDTLLQGLSLCAVTLLPSGSAG